MKISGKISKFLTDTLAKMSQHILAYFSVSEHSASFSEKKTYFGYGQGFAPPPVYGLVHNV